MSESVDFRSVAFVAHERVVVRHGAIVLEPQDGSPKIPIYRVARCGQERKELLRMEGESAYRDLEWAAVRQTFEAEQR